ncbi:stage II sporulation protein P [Bacillus benzoevorans]|uniref:Stage II sporulation protein P n=1 Tax=Bacillus benzoevorans TaxID=1456 RepID=A0A7X0HSH0_9BACI|nr:stage II sporulation protein P [Bacillus benzoevorans]MBB6445966.1 stage II sporulation protein P [Bacillus benzoevorans]
MKSQKFDRVMIAVKGTSIVKAVIGFILFLLLIFSVSGLLTSLNPQYRPASNSVNSAASNITGEMLYHLMGWENHYFLDGLPAEALTPKLSAYLFKLTTNINLDDPRSLLGRELPAFSLFDTEILVAGEGTNYTNMPIESAPPMEILHAEQEAALQNIEGLESGSGTESPESPPNSTGDRKVVYVYFTHNRESFLPYLEGVTNPNLAFHSQLNVTRIGDKLKEELEKRGIGTVVDKTDVQANLSKKGWSYVQSYQESREIVEAAVSGDRDLTYLIDIHRDSRRKQHTSIMINGKSYAKLAFIVGGEHANYEKNLAFANQLHDLLQQKYNGLSRGTFTKAGAGTNGKFNQDLSEHAILVEFGGVDNTFEELNRSAEALADVVSEYYWQAEKVNQPVSEPGQES